LENNNLTELKKIIELLLFINGKPISERKLMEVLETDKDTLLKCIEELKDDYSKKETALFIEKIGGGWQISTKPDYSDWVKKFFKRELTLNLSPQALETLSIILYKGPITRPEIEDIRKSDSSGVIRTLLEKRLIRISGRKNVPGKPLLYRVTDNFYQYFGIENKDDIPSWEEI